MAYPVYSPQQLREMSDADLRKEYSRLRKVANERINRLEKAGFGGSKEVEYNEGMYVPLKEVESRRELVMLTSQVSKFLAAKRSTVTGQRETIRRGVATWNRKGVNVTAANYDRFVELLTTLKSVYGVLYYEASVDLWEDYGEDWTLDDVDEYMDGYDI